ncbi:dihydroorotase [Flavihumibacter petaseus]|uniref:Putative dihydroorotase n=1 Tax=Flavihumibacter petaseus NBRC 106054 TaxID=1220578 RepID=A0A0E9N4V7_9BACT|nr:dihydroorotase [Flavihumibacter petaseus]GAO44992.1 putative dihydroorotase [Flavihumibacter petaseus NBRC 106054]
MQKYLIKNARIVNEGKVYTADLLLEGGIIEKIGSRIDPAYGVTEIDAEGQYLIPGVIDDQVHFREPGLTHKATIQTESTAAVAGGVTSFMEMPNTQPPVFTQELLENKYTIASETSLANYSFFMGTSNENYDEVMRTNEKKDRVCGIKIFMGSSTGGLLVDNPLALERIFNNTELLIATHCEDERIIRHNLQELQKSGRTLTAADHPVIRSAEACFESSFFAIQMAKKFDSRLHILHISTARELPLFGNMLPLEEKRITSEVCVHHLHFTADDYDRLGNLIKCNPAIKAAINRDALWEGLLDDRLDIIATDHAPHTRAEKEEDYLHAHAGVPLVQHSLLLMLRYVEAGKITIEKVVEKMCHAPATCFRIRNRGFIREGYHADLVLINPAETTTVSKKNIYYKCGWSPFEGEKFPASISHCFVNGHLAYAHGQFDTSRKGQRLLFNQ